MRRILINLGLWISVVLWVVVFGFYVSTYAQEPKQPAPAQQIEQLSKNLLDWKFKYGAETQLSARLQVRLMQIEKKTKELQAELVKCKAEKADVETEKTE